MRVIVWLLRGFVFFALFAFSLNNQQTAVVRWFFGVEWHAPLVIVVLAAFAGGAVVGVLAMVPSWWRHRRAARRPASSPSQSLHPAGAVLAAPAVAADGFPPRDGL